MDEEKINWQTMGSVEGASIEAIGFEWSIGGFGSGKEFFPVDKLKWNKFNTNQKAHYVYHHIKKRFKERVINLQDAMPMPKNSITGVTTIAERIRDKLLSLLKSLNFCENRFCDESRTISPLTVASYDWWIVKTKYCNNCQHKDYCNEFTTDNVYYYNTIISWGTVGTMFYNVHCFDKINT